MYNLTVYIFSLLFKSETELLYIAGVPKLCVVAQPWVAEDVLVDLGMIELFKNTLLLSPCLKKI